MGKWVTVREAAEKLGWTADTIQRAIRKGELESEPRYSPDHRRKVRFVVFEHARELLGYNPKKPRGPFGQAMLFGIVSGAARYTTETVLRTETVQSLVDSVLEHLDSLLSLFGRIPDDASRPDADTELAPEPPPHRHLATKITPRVKSRVAARLRDHPDTRDLVANPSDRERMTDFVNTVRTVVADESRPSPPERQLLLSGIRLRLAA